MRNNTNIFILLFMLILSTYEVTAKNTIVLKRGISVGKQMALINTRYEINDEFDLAGKTLSIPAGCELDFRGGTIKNGTIVLNDTKILNPSFSRMHFQGSTSVEYFDIKDYGAQAGDKSIDCAVLINELIALKTNHASDRNAKTIHIPNGTFYIKTPINLWAGWEAPVTLEGNGNTSTFCQLTDNEYIIKLYESHYVKNLRLTYSKRQGVENSKAVAIACQRAIFCLFENLTICKAKAGFGYISLMEQQKDYNPTGYKQQCYVSCNFRNIRIYESSGYALDFDKEFAQGDSGSAFDNIYINSNDWLGSMKDNVSQGALRGDNVVACFTQLNIEGANYTSPLINLGGMSRVSLESLHLEGLKKIPTISQVRIQSVVLINMIDVQFCEFSNGQYHAFKTNDNGMVSVKQLTIRQDCKRKGCTPQLTVGNNEQRIKIEQILDPLKVFK